MSKKVQLGVELHGDSSSAQRAMRALRDETSTTMRHWRRFGSDMRSTGRTLSVAVTAPLALMGGAAIRAGMDFDTSMSKIKALTGATGADFEALRQQAIELGSSTNFSAKEAADGMVILGAAGFNTRQIMAAIPGVLNAAAASGETMADVSDILITAMNGFGLAASDAAHISDVLAKTANVSSVSIADVGLSLSYVAPVSKLANQRLEDVSAALAILGNAGMKADKAGTALRQGFLRLANPTTKAAKELRSMGVEAFDAHGKMLPLPQLIQRFTTAWAGMSDEKRLKALARIFGAEASPAWSQLISAGPEQMRKFAAAMDNADGTAKKMGDTMRANLSGALDNLRGRLETAGISLNDVVKNGLQKMADRIGDVVMWFVRLDPQTKRTIVTFAALAAAAGPALIVLGSIVGAITTLASAGGVALVLGGMTAALAAFAAVGGTLPQLHGALGAIVNTITSMKDVLAAAAVGFVAFRAALIAVAVASSIASAVSTLTFALQAVAGGAATAGEAFAMLGVTMMATPVGWIAAAVGVAAGAIAYFALKSNDARSVADQTAKAIGGVRDALLSLDDSRLAVKEANLGVATANAALDRARATLAHTKRGTQEYRDALLAVRQAQLGVERATQTARQAAARQADTTRETTNKLVAKRRALVEEATLQGQLAAKISHAMNMNGRAGAMARAHIGEWSKQLRDSVDRSAKLRPEIDKLNAKLDSVGGHGDKAAQGMRSTGREMSRGVAKGIKDGQGDVVSAAAHIADVARSTMRHLLGIKSPSAVMAETVGFPIAQGIAEGITRGTGVVGKAAERVMARLQSQLSRITTRADLKNAYWDLVFARSGDTSVSALEHMRKNILDEYSRLETLLKRRGRKMNASMRTEVLQQMAQLVRQYADMGKQITDLQNPPETNDTTVTAPESATASGRAAMLQGGANEMGYTVGDSASVASGLTIVQNFTGEPDQFAASRAAAFQFMTAGLVY